MVLKKNHIDRTFRAKLRNFSDAAPADVWEGVTGFLEHNRQRSRLFLIGRIAASVAIVISLGTAYLFLRNPAITTRQAGELITAPADTVLRVPVTEESQALLSETRETTGNEQGRENKAKAGSPVSLNEDAMHQTITVEDIQVSMLQPAALSGDQGVQPGQLLAAAGMEMLPAITSGLAGADNSGLERINAIREMPENKTIVAPEYLSEVQGGNLIVLIDENTQADEAHPDKWAVGTQVSPVYSYRDLGGSAAKASALSYYNNAESGMLAYAGGVNLSYLPAERLTVQSGVYYSKMGISVDHSYVSANLGPENAYSDAFKYNTISNSSGLIQTGSGNIEPYFTTGWSTDRTDLNGVPAGEAFNQLNLQVNESEVVQNFEYLEIPVILKYKMIDRRLGFNILGGMSTNLLIGSDAYLLSEGNREKIGRTTDLKTVNYSSTVGMGMDYALSSRFNLSLEPFFKYYLNSINQSPAIKSRPYTFGIFSGISFIF